MAIDFPSSPTLNQVFTSGGTSWQWDGTTWNLYDGSDLVTTSYLSTALGSYAEKSSPSISDPTITGTASISSANFSGDVSTNNLTVDGLFLVSESAEKLDLISILSNVATANFSSASVAYIGTAPSANFTINVTNMPTTDNRVMVMSFFVVQGSTGYIPSAIQIGGVSQTIKWSGGTAPTPTNGSGKVDVFTFTFIRRLSDWEVLGTSDTNY